MGDSGEGLIDTDSRIQERMEELAHDRARRGAPEIGNPELRRALESLRLARTELARQLESAVHERRRAQLGDALAEIDRRMAETSAQLAT